ncbi:hypothetical protein HAX54_005993 [Datura stramonium]|uniref:DUF295 domain-containing protein n=1 Tax=Datura stramonium TaxID=4076 RepID=A0ABS8RII9_DATST|nr:hypothetical protein [Datura stramonium]
MDNLVYITTYLVEVEGQIHAIMRLLFDTRITDTPRLNTWKQSFLLNFLLCLPRICESNCIYFTDDFSGVHYNAVNGYDMGIYNVQNGRVQPLLKEDLSEFAFSLPLWMIPSLS